MTARCYRREPCLLQGKEARHEGRGVAPLKVEGKGGRTRRVPQQNAASVMMQNANAAVS